ncbi:MAG: hypothetical protein ACTSU5_03175, partial [Promethearchaeota archaeon]
TYCIYRGAVGLNETDFDTLEPIANLTSTNYTDFVRWSGNWYYGVTAKNYSTGESNISAVVRSLVNIPYLVEEYNYTAINNTQNPLENNTDQFQAVTLGGDYYYAAGFLNQTYTENRDVYLAQINASSGELVNSSRLDLGFTNDTATCIDYSEVGNSVFVGGNIFKLGDFNYFLNKYDASTLTLEWSIIVGDGSSNQTLQAIELNGDEDKIGLAVTDNGNGSLVEIDVATGTPTMTKVQTQVDGYTDILYNNRTGSIYTLGYGRNFQTGDVMVMVYRYDKDGNLAKSNNYTLANYDLYANAFSLDGEGELIYITGYRYSAATDNELMTIKIDRNLNYFWTDYYGKGEAYDCYAYKGNVLVAGRFYDKTSSREMVALFEYSSFQEMVFNTTWYGINSTLDSRAFSMDVDEDRGYLVLAGVLTNTSSGDQDGFLTEYKIPVPINPILDEIPATVNHDGSVTLHWKNTQPSYYGVTYEKQPFWSQVYVDYELVVTTRNSSHHVSGLGNGTHLFYIVNENVNGPSEQSNFASMKVIVWTPLAPILLSATMVPNEPQVVLNWTSSEGATTYNVYYATETITNSNLGNYTASASTNSTSYTLQVTEEGDYFVVVTALNGSGESPVSNNLNFSISLVYFKQYSSPETQLITWILLGAGLVIGVVVVVILIKKR